MSAPHQIVIIGASFGGIPVAHGLLKDVLPEVSTSTKQSYKVTMISPSDRFWWKIGAPRVIVNPAKFPVERALLPIADGFKSYSHEQYEFIKAYVESIDPTTKTLRLSSGNSVQYDSLVISSGTSFLSPIWSIAHGTEPLTEALKDIHARLPEAKSILVAGAGAAGVETTGELAETYGGKKEITLLSGSTQLLHALQNKKVGPDAEAKLTRSGVTVIHDNLRVKSHTREGNQEVLILSDGTTKKVDVFIEATGDRPNSKFVPAAWLNEKKFVKTDNQTLRLDVAGVSNVYVFGSVGSYSNGSVMDTKFALKPILESIKLDLLGKGSFSSHPVLLCFATPFPFTSPLNNSFTHHHGTPC